MYISPYIIGWISLVAAVLLTFFFPLGREHARHFISQLFIFGLFIVAAFILIPSAWFGSGAAVKSIVIGVIVGLIAVLYRDVRRFFRFFRGKVYRVSHPYYWYERAFRRMWR